MARTHATEPAVYDRTAPTHGRNRTGAIAAAAVGGILLLAIIVWWIWGAATT